MPWAGSSGAGAGPRASPAGSRQAGANAASPLTEGPPLSPGGAPEGGSPPLKSAQCKALRGASSRSRFSQRRMRARQSRMVWPPTFHLRASHQSRKRRGSMPLPRWPQYSSTSAKLGGVKPEKASLGEGASAGSGTISATSSGSAPALPCPDSGGKAPPSPRAGRLAGAASCLEASPFPACPAGAGEAAMPCAGLSARRESPERAEALRLSGFAAGSHGALSPLPCPDSERTAGAAAFTRGVSGIALALASGSWFLALGALRFDAGRMFPHATSASW